MIFNSGAIRSVPRLTRRFLHHAVVLEKIGGIFSDQKLQSPSLTGDRQVRVQVDSCGVAYRDTLDREGAFPFISLPAVLGHEISGTVIEVSPGTDLAVGDKVVSVHWDQDEAWPSPLTTTGPVSSFLGLTLHGGYQELMVIPETALVKLESSIACRWTAAEAAVWMGAIERAQLRSGSVVMVTGASGGVGSASIALLKHKGCTIIAVTSSMHKSAYLESLGANHVLLGVKGFHKDPLLAEGVDMVIECTGEPTFDNAYRSLKPEGTLVLVGNTTNASAKLPIGLTILKSLKVVGSDSISRAALSSLFTFMTENNLRPHIDEIISLTTKEVENAHKSLVEKGSRGRTVIQVSQDTWK